MTNEQAKQKAIQEAWGLSYDHFKKNISSDGWLCIMASLISDFPTSVFDYRFKGDVQCLVRPKSLHGIEDNNGWNRIETVDDLPKEDGEYEIIEKHTEFNAPQLFPFFIYEQSHPDYIPQQMSWMQNVSHWRKKSPLPIY